MISQEEKIEVALPLTLEQRRAFMKLPIEERRKRLAEQADQTLEHYELELARSERAEWQGGDIVER